MNNIVELFFFSPVNVTVVEFLSNYFISILGFAFPIFILIAAILIFYGWATEGFQKESIKTLSLSLLTSVSFIAILLYTPGRKTIEFKNSNKTIKSFLVIDTINDMFNVGSRFADGFVYNMLFGKDYTGSNDPLLEFKPNGGMFQLIHNNNQPTNEDVLDGFFVNGMQQLILNKINKTNQIKNDFTKKYNKIFNDRKQKFNEGIKKIKDLTNNYINQTYYPLQYIALENIDRKIIQPNFMKSNTIDNLSNFSFNFEKYYYDLNNYEDFINKMKPDFIDYSVTVENVGINSDIKVKYLNTINNNGNQIFKKEILDYPVTSISAIGGTTLVNNSIAKIDKKTMKKMLKDVFIDKNTGQRDKEDFLKIEEGIKKDYNVEVKNSYLKEIDPSLFEKLKLEGNNIDFELQQTFQLYPELNKNEYTIDELKKIILTVHNLIRLKIEKRWSILYHDLMVSEKTNKDNVLSVLQLDEYLIHLKNTFPEKKSIEVNVQKFSEDVISQYVNIDTEMNAKVSKFLQNSLNSLYFLNNGLDLPKNADIKGIKLKYLEGDYLLKNKLSNNSGLLSTIIPDEAKKPSKTEDFHWYDLGKYAIGLKSLFMQNNSAYAFASGFKGENDSLNFYNKCLPFFYESKRNVNILKEAPEDIKKLCFPSNSNSVEKSFNSIANVYAVVKSMVYVIKYQLGFKNNKKDGLFTKIGKKIVNGAIKVGKKVPILGTIIEFGQAFILVLGTVGTYMLNFAIIYVVLMMIWYMIPLVFFMSSFLSWLFKASFAMITFGFSILLFIFTHKKDQLQNATLHVIMYMLMPIYISLMFLLIINTSFVLYETINTVLPNYSESATVSQNGIDNISYDYLNGEKDVTTLKVNEAVSEKIAAITYVQSKAKNGNLSFKTIGAYLNYLMHKGYKASIQTIHDIKSIDIPKTWNKVINFNPITFVSNNLLGFTLTIIDYFTGFIKLIIIIFLEIELYTNLWRVDKYLNEIIGTNIKDVEMVNAKAITRNFSKGMIR